MISDDNTSAEHAGSGWDDDLSTHVAAFFNKIKAEKEKSAAERYDYFISYAHEDATIAKALSQALKDGGLKIWIDQDSASPGISINRIIDEALKQCKRSVLLLSHYYFKKFWAQAEMDANWALSASNGKKVQFIPVRLGITQDELRDFSPMLAGLMTLELSRDTDNVSALAEKLITIARE